MALNDIYRVRWTWESLNERCGVTHDYRDDVGLDLNDAAENLLALVNPFAPNWFAGLLPSTVTFSSCYVRNISQAAMPARFQYTNVLGTDGAVDSIPFNKALVFSIKTTDPQAIRQGRMYFSGISKARTVSGVFEASFMGFEVATVAGILSDPQSGGGGTWIPVVTKSVITDPGPPPVYDRIPMDVSNVSAQGIIFSQRSRQSRMRALTP